MLATGVVVPQCAQNCAPSRIGRPHWSQKIRRAGATCAGGWAAPHSAQKRAPARSSAASQLVQRATSAGITITRAGCTIVEPNAGEDSIGIGAGATDVGIGA